MWELALIFTQIFNRSLELCEVPSCFKHSSIILLVPKKPKITGLNDSRPVALTSVFVKSFERMVLAYLKASTGPLLDPQEFAYRANRSVDDAVNIRSPSPPHHEQHCDYSGVIQVPVHHHLSGPEVGQSHWVRGEKGPAEVVFPSPAEKVQPVTGAVDTVLLCHHWTRPLHVNTFTFMHLADVFIQSDLQCIQFIHFLCQHVCSLGIEPTAFDAMLYHWATGTQ